MEMSGVPLTAQVSTDSLGSFTEAPGPPRKRKKYTRWNIPQEALSVLEEMYWKDKFPSVETRKALAEDLKVTPRQVQVWFQNKRQRAIKPDGSGGMMDEGDEPAPQARSNVGGRASHSVDLTRQQTEVFAADEVETNDVPLKRSTSNLSAADGHTAPSRRGAATSGAAEQSGMQAAVWLPLPPGLAAGMPNLPGLPGHPGVGFGSGWPPWPPNMANLPPAMIMQAAAAAAAAAGLPHPPFMMAPFSGASAAPGAQGAPGEGNGQCAPGGALSLPLLDPQFFAQMAGQLGVTDMGLPLHPAMLPLAGATPEGIQQCTDAANHLFFERFGAAPPTLRDLMMLSQGMQSLGGARLPVGFPFDAPNMEAAPNIGRRLPLGFPFDATLLEQLAHLQAPEGGAPRLAPLPLAPAIAAVQAVPSDGTLPSLDAAATCQLTTAIAANLHSGAHPGAHPGAMHGCGSGEVERHIERRATPDGTSLPNMEAVPVAAIASTARANAAMSAQANASAHLAAMSAAMSAQGGADGSNARFTNLGNFAALAQAFCAGSAQATEAARNLTPELLANAAANAAAAMAHTWGHFPQGGFSAQPPHLPPRAAQPAQGDPSATPHLHAPHFMGSLPFSSADAARDHHGASARRDGAARAMSAALLGAHHGGTNHGRGHSPPQPDGMEDLIESLFTEGIEMDALEQQLAEQQQQLAGRLKQSSHDRRAFGGGGSTASSLSGRAEMSTMVPDGRHTSKRGRSPRRGDFVSSASCASLTASAGGRGKDGEGSDGGGSGSGDGSHTAIASSGNTGTGAGSLGSGAGSGAGSGSGSGSGSSGGSDGGGDGGGDGGASDGGRGGRRNGGNSRTSSPDSSADSLNSRFSASDILHQLGDDLL